jgi:hypothetical protein
MNATILTGILFAGLATSVLAQAKFESDVLATSAGDLTITFR